MSDELLEKLQFDKFSLFLKEMLENGFGEITYKVVVKDKKVQYVALSRTNTYKPESGII